MKLWIARDKDDALALHESEPYCRYDKWCNGNQEWVATFYSHYSNNKFYGCGMCCDQCIPYEGNEYLCGTTNDCDDFYKTWK